MTNYRLVPSLDLDGNETGFYTREPDGVSGMTLSALSSLCCLAQGSTTTLSNLLTKIHDANPEANDLADSLKAFAGKDLRLEANDAQGRQIIPDEACQAILEYYAFEARKYSGQNEAVVRYRQINRAGMRLYIWSQTGFVPELLRPQLRTTTSVYIQRLENIRDHRMPDSMWTTFREGAEVLLLVEREMQVPVDELDLCDGSIGKRWSAYRDGKPWVVPSGWYTHVFRDQRGERLSKAYDLSELPYFRAWLRDIYIPQYLPEYFADKYGKLACREIYERLNDLNEYVLAVTKIKRLTPSQQAKYEAFKRLQSRLLGSRMQPGDLESIPEEFDEV